MRLLTVPMIIAIFTTPTDGQTWQLLEFTGSETFEFTLSQTTDGVAQLGTLKFSLSNAGAQPTASIDATIGDASCAATIPMSNPQAAAPMLLMQCAAIAPIALTMFSPMWAPFMGQQWTVGARMNMNQGNNSISFAINETCTYAGQSGLLAELRTNDMEIDTCVDPSIPLPLMVNFNNMADNQVIHAEMTRFIP
jgi:hypothetical protein